MNKFSRRDFLKLAWGLSQAGMLANLIPAAAREIDAQGQQRPNFVVLVCDAMTALNLSLYGYSRKTTPNIERLAERALVYHKHYSNGNFTSPGTASLLTGLLPWTHRSINGSGIVTQKLAFHNLFHFLGADYYRLGYTQNYWAEYLLDQFSNDMDDLLLPSTFDLINAGLVDETFMNDALSARRSFEKMFYFSHSLLLSFIGSLYYQSRKKSIPAKEYPFGLPEANYFPHTYTLEGLFEGITDRILELDARTSPFFSYFHVYPPHAPYHPRQEYLDLFKEDGYQSVVKRDHSLSRDSSQKKLDTYRYQYDGYLANIDMEIDRMVSALEKLGILDHTYFILTSDHGESFERGVSGHFTPLMYETLIRIPLLIFTPGNQTRRDIFTPTSNIDLLSTILTLAGKDVPDTCEGNVLPGLGGIESPERSIIAVDAKENLAFQPLKKATFAIVRGNHKLIHYRGYKGIYQDHFEFYNLEEDPEELHDRYGKPKYDDVIAQMKQELFTAIDAADEQYS
jgi:arylsulfatase A-like enzyme